MLVTHLILLKQYGENATTPRDPYAVVAAVDGNTVTLKDGNTVSLATITWVCRSSDDDMQVEKGLYSVTDVVLPEWLSPEEWLRDTTKWKWAWGMGMDSEWPESWQRGVASVTDIAWRLAAIKLLSTKNFKSDFRRKMRDQIVEWCETSPDDRRYPSPLSRGQWAAVLDRYTARDADRMSRGLYSGKGFRDARKAA